MYAGTDPLTGREIRFRKTCNTERDARIELGKLLALARDGGNPTVTSPSPSYSTSTRRQPGGTCPRGKQPRDTSGGPSDAASLGKQASAHGYAMAVVRRVRLLHTSIPATSARPTGPPAHASLDDSYEVATPLRALRKAGAAGHATALLDRGLAAHASLDNPDTVAWLLDALREAGPPARSPRWPAAPLPTPASTTRPDLAWRGCWPRCPRWVRARRSQN